MGTGTTARLQPTDLAFFAAMAGAGSLSAAARELGVTTPAVSKHLAAIEARLGLTLVNRTTRRMSLTPEGERVLQSARRVRAELDDLDSELLGDRQTPRGLLRVNATLGFGRSHIGPIVSRFARDHPRVSVQLQLSVNPPALLDDRFDVCVRFGPPPDARVIARVIAPNRRLLCASPAYLARHGTPQTPAALREHACIGIRQGEEAHGSWRLTLPRGRTRAATAETVKIRSRLTTNDGEIAVSWALDGHGILMRAEWDIRRYLQSGRLVQVLPQWQTPNADIHAVYPSGHARSARVTAFVDYLSRALEARAPPSPGPRVAPGLAKR